MDGTEALEGEQASSAATPPAATPAPAASALNPTAVPSTEAIAAQAAPAAAPTTATPTPPRTGILGVLDAVTNMLVSRDTKQVTYDDTGKHVAPGATLTRGQQYAKIGLEALSGAARGMAAPPGPAHVSQGIAAGIAGGINDQQQAEQKQDATAQQAYDAQQKAKMNAINYQLGLRKVAEATLTNKALEAKAPQELVDFSDKQIEMENKLGSYPLGVATNAADYADIISKLPNWEQKLYEHGALAQHTVYNDDGTIKGNALFLRPNGGAEARVPEDMQAPKWVPPTKPGEPWKTAYYTPRDDNGAPMKQADFDKLTTAYALQGQTRLMDQAKQEHEQAQAAAERANASKAPSEIAKNFSEVRKNEAETLKTRADAALNGGDTSLVDEIGTGKMALNRLDYLAARNPQLLAAVSQKYPDFDSSKVQSYIAAYKDFTSSNAGTAGGALNAGGTALKHLKELNDMNTVKSHIPGTADYNAYMNKVDTVAPELAKFYGDVTVPAIAALKSTLAATLPGNRHAAIVTQVKSMGDKFDSYEQTWQNAAPSKAYEAPMPGVDAKSMAARAALDPAYRQRQVEAGQPAPQGKTQPLTGPIQPGEHVTTGPKGTIVLRGNQWVDPATGQAVE